MTLAAVLFVAGCSAASAAPVPTPTDPSTRITTAPTVPSTTPSSTTPTDSSPPSTSSISTAGVPGTTPAAPLTANPFAEPVGTWLGGDIPRVYPLPDGRQVWWLNDSFVPPDGSAPVDQFEFVRNVLFIRGLDGAMTIHTGGTAARPWDFLPHHDPDHFAHFFWPMGGMVVGDDLKVFVAEMECRRPQWGICFRPIRTWLATYGWHDMTLRDLRPAANDGVRPVYGFSVVSDGEWTYLFGSGAEYNTPKIHGGSDQTYVARVPRGRLEDVPTYWDGSGWNADAAAAVSLVQRGYSDFRLSVIPWRGRYLGVAKEDEFVGRRIIVMTAPEPQGPWTDLAEIPMPLSVDHPDLVSYDAEPYPEPVNGSLAIIYSTNSTIEDKVFRDPSVYRPVVLFTDLR